MIENRTAISEENYRDWPAFREFRQSIEFDGAFRKLFRKQYVPALPASIDQAN
jgi:hypothetical protein